MLPALRGLIMQYCTLQSWWDCTLTFTSCKICWRVGSFLFWGEYLLLSPRVKKSVEAGGANVGFPFLKWFVQTVFCSLTWKPSSPFETFLTHCSRFSGFWGKWCHLVSFYMFPFPLLFRIPWVVVAASHAASIYWHNWAFFLKSDSHPDYDSVLVYPNNLTIIIMTSTLWTSLNSKKMLTKHLNDVTRCKKDADVHRHLPTMAAILFPHFKEACWLRKFEQYRGCIVGLLCGFSLRDYSWW